MKVYELGTTIQHPLAIVDFKDASGRIFTYFILNEGNGHFLNFTKPIAIAQVGYTAKNIRQTDYLQASIGIPIVSERAKDRLQERLGREADFVECQVECEGEVHTFYMVKVKTYRLLIDKERSSYRSLTDGTPLLTQAVYNHSSEPFLIARDREEVTRLVVSETFIALIEKEKLRIAYVPLSQ